jgi:hypothetical protein
VLCLAGVVGFATAIGVHPVVGYTNLAHLAPAILGAIIFLAGLLLSFKPMYSESPVPRTEKERSHFPL